MKERKEDNLQVFVYLLKVKTIVFVQYVYGVGRFQITSLNKILSKQIHFVMYICM